MQNYKQIGEWCNKEFGYNQAIILLFEQAVECEMAFVFSVQVSGEQMDTLPR